MVISKNSSLCWSERLSTTKFFQQCPVGSEELFSLFPRLHWLGSELCGWPWVRERKGRVTIDHCLSEVSNTCFRKENISSVHFHLNVEELAACQSTSTPDSFSSSRASREWSPLLFSRVWSEFQFCLADSMEDSRSVGSSEC